MTSARLKVGRTIETAGSARVGIDRCYRPDSTVVKAAGGSGNDSSAQKLLAQTSHYSLASLLTLVGGAMTFPLLTRVFSVQEYGVMSLIGATVLVGGTLGKTGLQHAVSRYFTEIATGKTRFSLRQLYATTILGMAATSTLVMVCLMLGSRIVPARWILNDGVRALLFIASFLVVTQVMESALTNLLRADQKSLALMKFQVLKKYFGLGCLFGGILLVSKSLRVFYLATLISDGTSVALLAVALFRTEPDARPSRAAFSPALYRRLLAFGLPMTFGYELAGLILNFGDRYVIKAVIGEAQLGLYAASYNLCQYIQSVFISSIGAAIGPITNRMFDEEGPEKTAEFCRQSLRDYTFIALPVIAGLASVGPELLPSLASSRYVSGAAIIPWVIAGMAVDGAASIVGTGLFLYKKTVLIMMCVAGSAVANVLCNLFLVPRLGILGAAISTLVSYALVFVTFHWGARRYLPVRIPWGTVLRASSAALIMYGVLMFLCPGRRFVTVGVRAAVGAVLYVGLISAIDLDGRRLAAVTLGKLRARLGRLAR
jgi:O-antigen/teichoic acid export membrane protein